MFDEDGDNNITPDELVNVLKFVDGMDLTIAKTIISRFDVNGDGTLQYNEFKQLMKDDNFIHFDE